MHFLDILVFTLYMLAVIGIGVWFLLKNTGVDDFYVGGRKIGSWHIGLSVVATDVGGGFSIGLG
ncbi:MAG: sodium:solute symporter family protein, partial [Bacteroidota bacterium]